MGRTFTTSASVVLFTNKSMISGVNMYALASSANISIYDLATSGSVPLFIFGSNIRRSALVSLENPISVPACTVVIDAGTAVVQVEVD